MAKQPVARSEEFKAGRLAFDQGLSIYQSPYDPREPEAVEWRNGYLSRQHGLFPSEEVVRP